MEHRFNRRRRDARVEPRDRHDAAAGGMNREILTAMLLRHEGERLKPYTDTTGHCTIGVGGRREPWA